MSKSRLEVGDITKGKEQKHPAVPHKNLPQHEFCMLIVAPRGAGKTNLICNIILKQYKGYFNNILVCSPTHENDEKWELVKEAKNILKKNHKLDRVKKTKFKIRTDIDEDSEDEFDGQIPEENFFLYLQDVVPQMNEIDKLIKEVREKCRDDPKLKGKAKFIVDRTLLVIDDQAGNFKATAYNNPLANFVMRHRHYGVSVIIVTQAFKSITSAIRTGCNCQVIFRIPNELELEQVYASFPAFLPKDKWLACYEHCMSKEHGFMYINSSFPKKKQVFSNFDKLLSISEEESSKITEPTSKEDTMTRGVK